MCGILGLIETPWNNHSALALNPLKPRGPDDTGSWEQAGYYLGHTRLSVIDIDGGHQPMVSNNGRFVLVFNGEIYNFKSLRKVLEKSDYKFSTASDTEVVLNGYIEWGDDLPLYLDGMFAFAVWDTHKKSLFCARDRVGIKPLFYSVVQGFSFSSSLKSFLSLPGFPTNIDSEALRDFLAYQTCLSPASFLKSVHQLPPASFLKWDSASRDTHVHQYWKPQSIAHTKNEDEVVDEVDDVLRQSVRKQLISDVPLGAFLSGGIDSSLMIHYMSEANCGSIDAFTMSFRQKGYDETVHAKEVARYFGCRHHILDAPEIDADTWVRSIESLDQPLADPAYVMTNALSKLTRKHVTVCISGDGGDELFAGYPRFGYPANAFPANAYLNLMRQLIDNSFLPGQLLRRSLFEKELLLYQQVELGPWRKGRKSMYTYVDPRYQRDLKIEKTLGLWRELAGKMDTKGLMDADLWTYLSENCLTKTDRASMSHGLEIRVPMLGNDVLDLATSIPSDCHFDGHGGKRILRELARRYLPESVWNRKKHGFSVPLLELFNTTWEEPIDDLMNRCDQIAPFLNRRSVQDLWKNAKRKKASRRLAYTMAVLLQWLDVNKLQT